MSISELSKFMGRIGQVTLHEMTFFVVVTDAKTVYGKVRFQVTPGEKAGFGQTWMDAETVKFPETLNHGGF